MNKIRKTLCIVFAVIVTISAVTFSSGAVQSFNDWVSSSFDDIYDSDGYVTLTPGTDNTQMRFAWQSSMWKKSSYFYISKKADMSSKSELSVEHTLNLLAGEYTHKSTATGLTPDTVYYYQYKADGKMSSIYSFTTGSTDSTRILFVTDPQIGRSDGSTKTVLKNDTYGWTSTIEKACETTQDISFIMCAGDQVETASSEKQYTMFESIPELRSIPIATAIGNHDKSANNYKFHFNNPNDRTDVSGESTAGNGYYFCYNNILFIVLDSNNTKASAHEKIIKAACNAYPNAQWRVAMFHHSPYDANSSTYSDNVKVRSTIAPYIDSYNIDLCLTGHDHYYSRSYMIEGNAVTSDTAVNDVYANPKGTLYVSGNSSSGSNYYPIDETALTEYCDVYYQSDVPNYSVIDIDGGSLTMTTYETSANAVIDQVSIVKN